MSNSLKLRHSHTNLGGGRGTQSTASINLERLVQSQENYILTELRRQYPHVTFTHTKILTKTAINCRLREISSKFGTYQSNARSHIRPDGGLYWAHFPDGSVELILVMEAKKQGTNDLRLSEGQKKQAMGNAVERTCKNFMELENYLIDKTYFPFLIMLAGDDLRPGSSIRDRLTSLIRGSHPNHCYVLKEKTPFGLISRASVFMQYEPWTGDEIAELALEVATQSMQEVLLSKGIKHGRSYIAARRFRLS